MKCAGNGTATSTAALHYLTTSGESILNAKAATTGNPSLASGSLLARNTLFSLVGQVIPVVAAFLAIPILLRQIGTDRFGLLTLAWAIIGYFSLFDLGLGRAVTKLVAEKIANERTEELPDLVSTSLVLMTVLGVVGGGILAAATPIMINSVLSVGEELRAEAYVSFILLSVAIPLVTTTSGLRGILEAQQQFGVVTAIRIPLGIFVFIGPLAALPFTSSLVPIVAILVISRIIGWMAFAFFAWRGLSRHYRRGKFESQLLKPLLTFGGWMTVSNVVSPLMSYLDRFIIGALLSISAIAYYSTPQEIVTKILIIPAALAGVVFPAFAATLAREPGRLSLLYRRSTKYIFLSIFPIVAIAIVFAHEALRIWIGQEFALQGAVVVQVLALGVLMNALAYVPFALLQGAGRSDVTAKCHLVELPLYLVAVWWLTVHYGVVGVALAWTLRVTLDALLLFVIAGKVTRELCQFTWYPYYALASVPVLLIAMAPTAILPKVLVALMILLSFGVIAWMRGTDVDEKRFLSAQLNKLFRRDVDAAGNSKVIEGEEGGMPR